VIVREDKNDDGIKRISSIKYEQSPYLKEFLSQAWTIFIDESLSNILNMMFLPLWFLSLFLLPWKFCTGSHKKDWGTIRSDYAKGYLKVFIVLAITFKNVYTFFCTLLSFIVFALIAVMVLVTPWRLRHNLCNRLA
jgi:hypothetical protein